MVGFILFLLEIGVAIVLVSGSIILGRVCWEYDRKWIAVLLFTSFPSLLLLIFYWANYLRVSVLKSIKKHKPRYSRTRR